MLPLKAKDVLEADEMWSFVAEKAQNRWIWTVMNRRTRQIVAFVIGDRNEKTCQQLWEQIPEPYRSCQRYKRLRQSNARFVRKTLSFSRSGKMHEIVTRLFFDTT
ncbi:MAG: hypothetical protein Kow002_08450 [Anaerolineales bacterium]